jgi:ribokinase
MFSIFIEISFLKIYSKSLPINSLDKNKGKHMNSGNAVVIGSLNMDMVINLPRVPQAGETILCKTSSFVPGGKGANQAYAAARLGMNVSLIGAVGDDEFARTIIHNLEQAGVNTSGVKTKKNAATGLAVVSVEDSGENSIIVIAGANSQLTPDDIDNSLDVLQQAEVVILQLEIPLETVAYAAKLAKSLGKKVILDPAPAMADLPAELYKHVDLIKPNETELSILTGMSCENMADISDAVQKIKTQGIRDVVVTLGSRGVYMNSDAEGIHHVIAHKVSAVDTTAAGDSFTAAMAMKLIDKENLLESIKFANYVSSIVVTREGAQSSIPTINEVIELKNS